VARLDDLSTGRAARRGPEGELIACSLDGRSEPRATDRLHEVVERGRLERAHRVVVERRYEHHQRIRRAERREDLEAVAVGHLHVEQHEVGLLPSDRLERLGPGRALRDHGDVRELREHPAQAARRERLVVGQHHTKWRLHEVTSTGALRSPTASACGASSNMVSGSESFANTPAPGRLPISSDARSP
jgi:hypothetical protein